MYQRLNTLFFASSLCDNGHTVKFKNRNCVIKKKNYVVGVGERAGRISFVKLQCTSEEALEATEDNGYTLIVCHSRLSNADGNAMGKMVQSNAVCGMDLTIPFATNNCSPCIAGTKTNTTIKSLKLLETRPGAIVHTSVA